MKYFPKKPQFQITKLIEVQSMSSSSISFENSSKDKVEFWLDAEESFGEYLHWAENENESNFER
jgi:hypothetical protein